jgi:hypothetical protein
MRPFVHILMLWILIVTLPLQAVAAAINVTCTMAHESAPGATAAAFDDCGDAGTAMPQATEQIRGDVRPHMPCDQSGHHKHASCLACAGCCAGASAPPPFAFAGPYARHVAARYAHSPSSFTGWIPSRIERPPRT